MRTALLVDDDQLIRRMLGDFLRGAGYAVLEAADGEAGCRLALECRPDVVLVDLAMPVVDGAEVCRRLRSHADFQQTIIILMTARCDLAVAVNPFQVGADDYLSKPIDQADLLARLHGNWLKKRDLAALHHESDLLRRAKRQLEEELRIKTVYEQLFENASEGLVAFDGQGRVLFANRKSQEITGFSKGDLQGINLASLLDMRSLRRLMKYRQQAGEGPTPLFDVYLKTRNGIRRQLSMSLNDRPLGTDLQVLAFRDVTARRQMEKELITTKARLEQANDQLQKLDRARAEFLNTATHELRIPVTILSGYLSLLQEIGTGNLTAEQKEYLAAAVESSERLVDLTNNMLDLSRLESGKMAMEIGERDICLAVQEVWRDFQPLAMKNGIHLEMMSNIACSALFDLDQIRRVLANLVGNAIKFTPAGGRVGINMSDHDGEVRVAVEDTGKGIPRDRLPELFEEFVQLGKDDSRKGTGLGLSICRKIIASHNGRIWAESTPGVGSKFIFTLPKSV